MVRPLCFSVIGSGWRSEFYVRIARRWPERFHLQYMLCRTELKAKRMALSWGVSATTSLEQVMQAKPDFVVIAVSKPELFAQTEFWSAFFPVVCETPAALNVKDLQKLWNLSLSGRKIQIAEQYSRYPVIADGLSALPLLGETRAVTLSLCHNYHGVSLIRAMLGGEVTLESVTAEGLSYPVMNTDSRGGPIRDGSTALQQRNLVLFRFREGKTGLYDFSSVQYFSDIRARHVNVQGTRGEWNDGVIRWVDETFQPQSRPLGHRWDPRLTPVRPGPEALDMSQEQDEYALATLLYDMTEYFRTGREVYPLAQALEDAYEYLLMERALAAPGTAIVPEPMPWNEREEAEC